MAGGRRLVTELQPPTGGAPLLVFLPGVSPDPEQWDLVLRPFAGTSVGLATGPAVLPHPRFEGRVPLMAELVAAVCDELAECDVPILLVAHSVGSFVAFGIARELGDRLVGAVVINGGLATVGRFIDRPWAELRRHPRTCLTALRLFALVGAPASAPMKNAMARSETAMRLVVGNLISGRTLRSAENRRMLSRLAGSPASLRALWRNRHHWQTFVREAADVSTTVLFVVGADDPIAGCEDTADVAGFLPHTSKVCLPTVGHAAPVEAPDEVVGSIRAFLDEHLGGGELGAHPPEDGVVSRAP
jgi:pimeloyl-ACP methyl ester carboxylesterase